jgi:uncharacterized protein YbcC (UPF0753/DUF2309 family)
MQRPAVDAIATDHPPTPQLEREHLRKLIEKAAHLLPAQGPLNVFIHHNTLHAFEELPFNEALRQGAQIFGCQPYLSEDRYRQELLRGRIRFSELREALEQDLGERAGDAIPCFGTRLDLRLAMLQFPLRVGPSSELVWYVAEANALNRIRPEVSSAERARLIAETRRWVIRDLRGSSDNERQETPHARKAGQVSESLTELLSRFSESSMEHWSEADWERFALQALWRVCCDGVRELPAFRQPPDEPMRHRDLLLAASGEDSDLLVHDLLIRFSAAFLDQGLARWTLPGRDAGFYQAFCRLYGQPLGPPDRWLRGLARELRRLQAEAITPLECIRESLEILGVAPEDHEVFLEETILALRGWAGMLAQVEVRPDRVVHPVPGGSLFDFLAVRLVLDRFALAHVARETMDDHGSLSGLRDRCRRRIPPVASPGVEQRAFLVFQLAQLEGLSPDVLYRLDKYDWRTLVEEIERFDSFKRRRIFHLAYERRFYTQAVDAIVLHQKDRPGVPSRPRFQAIFCIDDREESFRRHIEEIEPRAVTYSTAGFFSVPMYYRGVMDAHFVPLCPAVVRPRHWVVERVVESHEEDHRAGVKRRRALGLATHGFHVGSRSLTLGALLAGALGVLATVPLVARTLFPRFTSRLGRRFHGFVHSTPRTRLRLERTEEPPGEEEGHLGFRVREMTEIAERVLREIGLTSGFSRLVLVLGHGSSSLNNPHASAYDCGACGGAQGGANARALAQMLNDPRVREGLVGRGLVIPPDCRFVGGLHNTSAESLTWYDLDLIPGADAEEFEAVRQIMEIACDRNAHERARRFLSAPLGLSLAAARQHVETRGEDLAQVRAELGHATNALCVVGRRERTRGLFLDRRAFLCSYDPTQDDDEQTILTRVLAAVFPVCCGINLEYYFSYMDNNGWGSGTKLPHNVAGLLGVMDGSLSDLRTGLPWQMVEIHEPVRLLMVVETSPEAMLQVMERHPEIGRLCRNRWVRIAVLDPGSEEFSVFQAGAFRRYEPQASAIPRASSSIDWYRGWRDHLEFAEIAGHHEPGSS